MVHKTWFYLDSWIAIIVMSNAGAMPLFWQPTIPNPITLKEKHWSHNPMCPPAYHHKRQTPLHSCAFTCIHKVEGSPLGSLKTLAALTMWGNSRLPNISNWHVLCHYRWSIVRRPGWSQTSLSTHGSLKTIRRGSTPLSPFNTSDDWSEASQLKMKCKIILACYIIALTTYLYHQTLPAMAEAKRVNMG